MSNDEIFKKFDNYAGEISFLKNNKIFNINWSPDFFCNYSCSYCWPGAHSSKRTHLPAEIIISGLINLKRKIIDAGFNYINLSFAGGEPTLVPCFLDLVKTYAEDNTIKQLLSVNTNLTHGKKWWNEFLIAAKKVEKVAINASWHRESVGDIITARDRFIEVHELFKSQGRSFSITIVVPPSQFDDVYSDALFFRKNKIHTLIRVERKSIENNMLMHPEYTQDMIDDIVNWNEKEKIKFLHKENGITIDYSDVEQAIALGKTDYYGWKCYGGTSSVVIWPNGDIKRGHICKDDKIGNLADKDYSLFIEPKKCITSKCGCAADMYRPKVK